MLPVDLKKQIEIGMRNRTSSSLEIDQTETLEIGLTATLEIARTGMVETETVEIDRTGKVETDQIETVEKDRTGKLNVRITGRTRVIRVRNHVIEVTDEIEGTDGRGITRTVGRVARCDRMMGGRIVSKLCGYLTVQ